MLSERWKLTKTVTWYFICYPVTNKIYFDVNFCAISPRRMVLSLKASDKTEIMGWNSLDLEIYHCLYSLVFCNRKSERSTTETRTRWSHKNNIEDPSPCQPFLIHALNVEPTALITVPGTLNADVRRLDIAPENANKEIGMNTGRIACQPPRSCQMRKGDVMLRERTLPSTMTKLRSEKLLIDFGWG